MGRTIGGKSANRAERKGMLAHIWRVNSTENFRLGLQDFFFFFFAKKSWAYESALRNSGVQCDCSLKCVLRRVSCKHITESLDAVLGPGHYPVDHGEPLQH